MNYTEILEFYTRKIANDIIKNGFDSIHGNLMMFTQSYATFRDSEPKKKKPRQSLADFTVQVDDEVCLLKPNAKGNHFDVWLMDPRGEDSHVGVISNQGGKWRAHFRDLESFHSTRRTALKQLLSWWKARS